MQYKDKWYDNKAFLQMLFLDKRMSVDEIAEYIGISSETVRKLLIKHRMKRGR